MEKAKRNKFFARCCPCVRISGDYDAPLELPINDTHEGENVIIVKNIDPCLVINGIAHHTSKYELMRRTVDPHLVVRRGQSFQLHITLSRPYDDKRDLMSFIFQAEDDADARRPTYGQGTLVAVSLLPKHEASCSWRAELESASENIITVRITPAPDCVVARWKMEVDTKARDARTFVWNSGVYILFNPWCKQDQVYMESEEWKEEAVISSDGLIWRGTSSNFRPVAWKYAQYDRNILDCSLCLMTKIGSVRGHLRSDPVEISRALSAAVNAQDDDGVVVGNWGTDFSRGTPPTQWNGSLEILSEYHSKKRPVRYGQCWVFAGVLTTVCRALGLPSRVVTNFSSAHDSDGSITIDNIVDVHGKIVEQHSDSIWNFHVWSEVWMARPDLGETYDGWQAIDSTPQEASNGMYRCGPASVVACKQGDVKKPYDVVFVFAEVNADVVYWHLNAADNSMKVLGKSTYEVGQHISTKAPGKFERLDLTDCYKHEENSAEERATTLKAVRQAEHMFSRCYVNQNFHDLTFEFGFLDDVVVGQPFDVTLTMRNANDAEKTHTVNTILRIDLVTYTGKFVSTVKSRTYSSTVGANAEAAIALHVDYDEYSKRLADNCAFNISCLAEVEGVDYHYFDCDQFRVRMPDVKITLTGMAQEGREVSADVVVENPLPVTLSKGQFFIEAPGLGKQVALKIKEDILPGRKATQSVKFTPVDPGRQTIAAKFKSKQLSDVDGFLQFVVEPKK